MFLKTEKKALLIPECNDKQLFRKHYCKMETAFLNQLENDQNTLSKIHCIVTMPCCDLSSLQLLSFPFSLLFPCHCAHHCSWSECCGHGKNWSKTSVWTSAHMVIGTWKRHWKDDKQETNPMVGDEHGKIYMVGLLKYKALLLYCYVVYKRSDYCVPLGVYSLFLTKG